MSRTQPKKITVFEEQDADRRMADRQKLVLRVGLLEQGGRPILCLVKNISAAGVQVKPFDWICSATTISLRVGDETSIPGTVVWSRDGHLGVRFRQLLNPQGLLRIGQKVVGLRRRTVPRVNMSLQACVRTGGIRRSATICDLSMVGARLRTVSPVRFGETMMIEVPGFPSLKAYVRWSAGAEHGVSFQAPLSIQTVGLLFKIDQTQHVTRSNQPPTGCATLQLPPL